MINLNPCPFCSNTEPAIGIVFGTKVIAGERVPDYYVACSCGARGPSKDATWDVVNSWNNHVSRKSSLEEREQTELLDEVSVVLEQIQLSQICAEPAALVETESKDDISIPVSTSTLRKISHLLSRTEKMKATNGTGVTGTEVEQIVRIV